MDPISLIGAGSAILNATSGKGAAAAPSRADSGVGSFYAGSTVPVSFDSSGWTVSTGGGSAPASSPIAAVIAGLLAVWAYKHFAT